MRALFGRGSIYTIVIAAQMSSSLLVVPVITRLLGPSHYGEVAAALVVTSVLSMIGAAGLPQAASRAFFQKEAGPTVARQLALATLGPAVALGLIAEATGSLWSGGLSLDYSAVLRLAVLNGTMLAMLLPSQALLRAEERVAGFVITALVGTVGAQLLGLSLTVAFRTPAAYVGGLAAGTGAAALVGLVLSGAIRHGLPSLQHLRAAFRIGLPVVPHGLAIFLLAAADRVAIAATLGLAATGRYQVAYAVGGLGVSFAAAFNQAWIPLMLGTARERRWRVLADTSAELHAAAALVAGALALAAPLALRFAAPASYGRGSLVPVAAIVAFSVLPYATLSTLFNVKFLDGRTGVFAIAAPLAAAFNIGLNLAILPVVGLVGASLATVAAYALLAAIIVLPSRRVVRLPGLGRMVAVNWALGAALVTAGSLLPGSAAGIAGRLALGALIVGIAAHRLLRFRRHEAAGAPAEAMSTVGAPAPKQAEVAELRS